MFPAGDRILLKHASAANETFACFAISPRYKCKHVLFVVHLFHPVFSSSGQYTIKLNSIVAPEEKAGQ